MLVRVVLIVMTAMTLVGPVEASERKDIAPGEANWHRYRFFVVGTEVSVRQTVTMLWDNTGAAMLVALYDTGNPAAPKLIALSTGNDRLVTLDIGLMKGTYQLIVAAVVQPTHYHLNVTYGNDELLFQQPNGPLQAPSELFSDRLISEDLAPYLARLREATTH
jgi:hypothetical protein